MAGPLRSARIVYTGAGKDVIEGSRFRKHVALNPEEEEDYLLLIDLISSGQEVPDRFCSAIAGHANRLLADYGVMHLHLGGAGSSTLLFSSNLPIWSFCSRRIRTSASGASVQSSSGNIA